MKFKLHFKNKHLLIELPNGPWLVDTGSPFTFGEFTDEVKAAFVEMTGRTWSPSKAVKSVANLDAAAVSGFIDCKVQGLIGGDILNLIDVRIDIANGVFETSSEKMSLPGSGIDMKQTHGLPVLDVGLSDGRICPMIFDTGAQISYLETELPAGAVAKGNFEDFSPFVGKFSTPTHELDVKLGNLPLSLRFGRLPRNLAAQLPLTGCNGIIGSDILINRVAYYSPRQKKLVLEDKTK
jgi:hypothetical protein